VFLPSPDVRCSQPTNAPTRNRHRDRIQFWQKKLGGIADAVGRVLRVSGTASSLVLRWVWAVYEGQGTLPFWIGTSLSPTTVLYAIGLTLLAAAIAGVVPALKVTSGGVDVRLRAACSRASFRCSVRSAFSRPKH